MSKNIIRAMEGPNLSVALLFKNLKDAKEISSIFKKIGIYPYFYTDLKSFWAGVLESKPSLCVVDILMMSEGQLILKNHPMIKTEELPLSFFCSDSRGPLIYSTFDIFHLGFIKSETSYSGQIKSILKRFNKMNNLQMKQKELSVDNKQLSRKVEKLIIKAQDLSEKKSFDQYLSKLNEEILNLKSCETFEEATALFIKEFKEVDAFGMMELSKNSQKLISSECFSLKFKKIPTLWIGKSCLDGIEGPAQVLASQVVMELIDGAIICLNIDGIKEHPDRMIYLQIPDGEFLEYFDWITLERNLSSLYNYFMNKNSSIKSISREMKNPFELMSFLDAFKYSKLADGSVPKGFSDEDYLLIDINLDNIIDLALSSNIKGRFYWKEFFQDFSMKIQRAIDVNLEVIPMGTNHIALLIDQEDRIDLLEAVRKFSLRFSYWRYFEDADMILSRSMKPEVKCSAFSAFAYHELISGDLELLNENNKKMANGKIGNKVQKIEKAVNKEISNDDRNYYIPSNV